MQIASFHTDILPALSLQTIDQSPALQRRFALRQLDAKDWIETHASGTLRKNMRLGFAWHDQYLHERVKYEFGDGFEILPSSRVTIGRPHTTWDCKPVTEAGWYIERYLTTNIFQEDDIAPAYIQAEFATGDRREGIGMHVRQTSAAWIGKGKCLFAIVSAFDVAGDVWLDAENPF